MKLLGRRLFNFAAAVSLLGMVAAVVLWRLVGMLAVFFVLLVWVIKVGLWMWPTE